MKRILCAALMAATLATPALGAKLYLKDGGVIQAKRVWRSDGKVHVLATRDTMTSFEPGEVNLKRTFPASKPTRQRSKVVRRRLGAVRPARSVSRPTPQEQLVPQPEQKKRSFGLTGMPRLPEKSPESLVPSKGGGGAIRQHRKMMQERLGE